MRGILIIHNHSVVRAKLPSLPVHLGDKDGVLRPTAIRWSYEDLLYREAQKLKPGVYRFSASSSEFDSDQPTVGIGKRLGDPTPPVLRKEGQRLLDIAEKQNTRARTDRPGIGGHGFSYQHMENMANQRLQDLKGESLLLGQECLNAAQELEDLGPLAIDSPVHRLQHLATLAKRVVEDQDSSDVDAGNEFADLCVKWGWDVDNDQEWQSWCLKATPDEIVEQGLRKMASVLFGTFAPPWDR